MSEQQAEQNTPETGTPNPNQGTEDEVDKTRSETVDTNAGEDARSGGVAEADIGEEDNADSTDDSSDDSSDDGARAQEEGQ